MFAEPSFRAFLATHPVFRTEEVLRYLGAAGTTEQTRRNLLHYHVRSGHIVPVRNGLYATVRTQDRPDSAPVDPFLVAARSADDAVLTHHTALSLHGYAYSVTQRFTFLTERHMRPFTFRGQHFTSVPFPPALIRRGAARFGIRTVDRAGVNIDVTGLERALVDVLDRPDLGGGWEEIWRSLESVPYFDLDEVVEYALLLDNATTAAKVGFFLEQHRMSLLADERHLARLRAHRPKGKHYLDPAAPRGSGSRRPGRLVPQWNLVVPVDVIERSWEEPGGADRLSGEPPAGPDEANAPHGGDLPA